LGEYVESKNIALTRPVWRKYSAINLLIIVSFNIQINTLDQEKCRGIKILLKLKQTFFNIPGGN